MKTLYDNIGKKIMVLAQIIGVVGLIAAVISFIYALSNDGASYYIPCCVFIALFLSSWPLYGFGQVVEDVRKIVEAPGQAPAKLQEEASKQPASATPQLTNDGKPVCPRCGAKQISAKDTKCYKCGFEFHT